MKRRTSLSRSAPLPGSRRWPSTSSALSRTARRTRRGCPTSCRPLFSRRSSRTSSTSRSPRAPCRRSSPSSSRPSLGSSATGVATRSTWGEGRRRWSRSSRGPCLGPGRASQRLCNSTKAVTQQTTTAVAVIQARILSPERTARSQKKALARAQETAPRKRNWLTSVPVELAGDLAKCEAEADGAAVRAGGGEAAGQPVSYQSLHLGLGEPVTHLDGGVAGDGSEDAVLAAVAGVGAGYGRESVLEGARDVAIGQGGDHRRHPDGARSEGLGLEAVDGELVEARGGGLGLRGGELDHVGHQQALHGGGTVGVVEPVQDGPLVGDVDRKSTRLNSSHANISYAVFCLKKKKNICSTHTIF